MGKLKTVLGELADRAAETSQASAALGEELVSISTNVGQTYEQLFEGLTSLYIYIVEKLQAEGVPADEGDGVTLLELKDDTIKGYQQSLSDGRQRGIETTRQWAALAANEGEALKQTAREMLDRIADIQGMIERRRKRLLQSKLFKEKINGYEVQLNDLAESVRAIDLEIRGGPLSNGPQTENQFNKLTVTPQTTLADIKKMVPFADQEHQQALADLQRFQNARKRFRERNMAAELLMIRQWIADAQEMEAEMEADDALPSEQEQDKAWLSGDNARVIEDVRVTFNNKPLFKVKKGTFKPKDQTFTCVLAAPQDLSGQLDRKVIVFGTHAHDGSKFQNDMKLTKIGTDQKTLTLKALQQLPR